MKVHFPKRAESPLRLVLDSCGLKVYGESELNYPFCELKKSVQSMKFVVSHLPEAISVWIFAWIPSSSGFHSRAWR